MAALPAAASAAWSIQTSALTAVIIGTTSCPSSTTCVQENNAGKFQYTTNGGTTWTASAADLTDSTWGMDCPSTTLCFATGDNGNIYKSTNLGVSWTTVSTGTPALYGIDCPSTTVCYAVSGDGRIRKTTDGGTTWPIGTAQATGGLFSVSCPTTTVCYAVGAAGNTIKKRAASDTWDEVSTSAARPDILSPYTHSLSCPSLNVCYEGATAGEISKTSDGGNTWATQTTTVTPDIYALQCASDTRCIAVGVANKSVFTDDGGTTWTTENTGSAAAMYSVTWADGSTAMAGDAIGKPYVYGAPQPPDADLDVSETLNPGSLSFIDSTPADVTFPGTALSSANQTVTAAQPITVADATGSGSGWSVAVTSTTFTTGSQTLSNNATTVLTAPSLACKAATTCTLATNSVSYPFTLPAAASAPTAQKLFTAAVDTGLGAQTITPTWSLAIPATTYAGTYNSTWTFTLSSGP